MKIKLHSLLVVASLIFGGVVLSVSIVKGVELGVLAQESDMVQEEVQVEEDGVEVDVNDEIEEQAANYHLPYPGILPDHPLYALKMVRDRLVDWLTFDKVKKVELFELYADKRIGAARALVEGGQAELGVETARKAVRYQERAIEKTKELKREGRDIGDVGNQIEKATAKHEQVLSTIEEKAAKQGEEGLSEVKGKVRENRRTVLEVLER